MVSPRKILVNKFWRKNRAGSARGSLQLETSVTSRFSGCLKWKEKSLKQYLFRPMSKLCRMDRFRLRRTPDTSDTFKLWCAHLPHFWFRALLNIAFFYRSPRWISLTCISSSTEPRTSGGQYSVNEFVFFGESRLQLLSFTASHLQGSQI